MHNGVIMPTDVRCLIEDDQPYPLVRLVGPLDLPAADPVRDALLSCLADQQSNVIVDVSELTVADPAALVVFDEVAREAAEWSAGPLVICSPLPLPLPLPPAAGADRMITVSGSLAEARQLLDGHAEALSVWLEPVVGAARRARELVTEGCARWDVPELAGSACIAVTELVNNVVAHARTPMGVWLGLRGGALHAAVRDYSPQLPSWSGLVPTTSSGGRGLLLIDTVARRWGTTTLPDGKVVWSVLYPEDEPLA